MTQLITTDPSDHTTEVNANTRSAFEDFAPTPTVRSVHREQTPPASYELLAELWARAIALPRATIHDFRYPDQFDQRHAEQLRLIRDQQLRSELIRVRMAVATDVARGRQPATSILRLTPHLEDTHGSGKRRRAKPPANPKQTASCRPRIVRPTVEQLRKVLERIAEHEQQHLTKSAELLLHMQRAVADCAHEDLLPRLEALSDLVRSREADARREAVDQVMASLPCLPHPFQIAIASTLPHQSEHEPTDQNRD
jgi:hypothetical protein